MDKTAMISIIFVIVFMIIGLIPPLYLLFGEIRAMIPYKRNSTRSQTRLTDMPYKIIAIDFDGVLFRRAWPAFNTASRPILKNIKRALRAQNNGAKLILWTCRTGTELEKAIMMCKAYGLLFDAINANLPERIDEYGNDCRKISADEYWDDKARRV